MTPRERKARTEAILSGLGAAVNLHLPVIEGEAELRLRTAREVAQRAICLLTVAAAADGVDRSVMRGWLTQEGLWELCSPAEVAFLSAAALDEDQAIQLSWRAEALWLLLWAIGVVDDLGPPSEQCSVNDILAVVPTLGDSTSTFIDQAQLRPVAELLDASDLAYRAHWAVRNHSIDPSSPIGPLHPGVVMERHYALNWLTRYGDSDWDDVATDT